MPVETLLSVEDYLHSSFEYDKEYVDGELIERKMPSFQHAEMQAALGAYVFPKRREWNVKVLTAPRTQVRQGAFRLPDIAVVGEEDQPEDGVIRIAPIFVIEIVSPDDGIVELRTKAREYLQMGVKHVWSVDPISGECHEHHLPGMNLIPDGVLRVKGTPIEIPVPAIIASL
jgi:Uma2 family endonuclease